MLGVLRILSPGKEREQRHHSHHYLILPLLSIVLTMVGRFLTSRLVLGRRALVPTRVSVAPSTTRFFSTNLNEDNSLHNQHNAPLIPTPRQEWSNYNDKIPVLKDSSQAVMKNEAELFGEKPRVSVLMELTDRVGVLHDVLKYFWKYDVNVSYFLLAWCLHVRFLIQND